MFLTRGKILKFGFLFFQKLKIVESGCVESGPLSTCHSSQYQLHSYLIEFQLLRVDIKRTNYEMAFSINTICFNTTQFKVS